MTFQIAPDLNFLIDELIIDGAVVPTSNQYTFSNVTKDHSIHCTFAAQPLPKYEVIYAGYDFDWKDINLIPNFGSGGGGPEIIKSVEQGQRFIYTYPISVRDPELPIDKQFDIPFQYVEINGVKFYSRNISITIYKDTYIRAYYAIDRN